MSNIEKGSSESAPAISENTQFAVDNIKNGEARKVAEHLKEVSDLDHSTIAETLLAEGEIVELLRFLNNFEGLNTQVASLLIEKGYAREVSENPSSFDEEDHNEILKKVIEAKQGGGIGIANNLEQWTGLTDEDTKKYVAKFVR